jgi:hypothetical protein
MPKGKLTTAQVRNIKRALHHGESVQAQAYLYGVCRSDIWSIQRGRYYKDVLPSLTKEKRRWKRITPSLRIKVLNLLMGGYTYAAIGRKLDMHPQVISRIKNGK